MQRTLRLALIAACVLYGTCIIGARAEAADEARRAMDDDGRIVSFQRDIVPIFRDRCLECHNVDEAKADFRIDDPETVSYYVEPGDVEASSLFIDYVLSEDPDMMMPPPSKGGPLSPQELTLIRVWIEEGAYWPDGVTIAVQDDSSEGEAVAAEPVEKASSNKTLAARVWAFQGFFHPATVHFPIALFLLGGLYVLLTWKWPSLGDQVPRACLFFGALSAVVATAMGWSFAVEEGYGSWTKVDMDSEVFWHRWSAIVVTVTSVILAGVALAALGKENRTLTNTWKVGLLLLAGMVGAVGHQGGEMTYGSQFYTRAFDILRGTEGESAGAPAAPIEEASQDQPEDEPSSDESEAVAAAGW